MHFIVEVLPTIMGNVCGLCVIDLEALNLKTCLR